MDDPNEIGSPNRFIFKEESYAIIGAALDVYYKLGSGFLEPVYQEALAIEFQLREIPCVQQVDLPIIYKDYTLKKTYRADFVCYDSINHRDQSPFSIDNCGLGSTDELSEGFKIESWFAFQFRKHS